jgi:A/G-specific adenine glycosylase
LTAKIKRLVPTLLDWFAQNARDLPWRRTRDPYAIWVSEIMLQQTQVKTVIPFWERWLRELPTVESLAVAPPAQIHKLWEGLGYYTRVRNMQKAAQQIVAGQSTGRNRGDEAQTKKESEPPYVGSYKFPDNFDAVLALPGVGRYTAGAICSIAFNQPAPILDGNVMRVLTRVFGIAENPKEKITNAKLWKLAEDLVKNAETFNIQHSTPNDQSKKQSKGRDSALRCPDAAARRPYQTAREYARPTDSCSHLNQSLMELGALVCTPRNPQCAICPVKTLCIAFREGRVEELPNLGKRAAATARRFAAFVVERDGKFLVRQRPAGVVNAHLWEFPNVEIAGTNGSLPEACASLHLEPRSLKPLCTVKHSITRYRITLEAYRAEIAEGRVTRVPEKKDGARRAHPSQGVWLTPAQLDKLAFTSAHRKILACLMKSG